MRMVAAKISTAAQAKASMHQKMGRMRISLFLLTPHDLLLYQPLVRRDNEPSKITRIYSVGAGAADDGRWGRLRRPLLGSRDETQQMTQASHKYPHYIVNVHYRIPTARFV